jgi:hypothetical protein
MPNQEQSRDGIPQKDTNRPSPDVQQATDGQASARGTGDSPGVGGRVDRPTAGDEKGMPLTSESPSGQDYRGDGPAKVGVTSDDQPDLVSPSGVNERDHGSADDAPPAGGGSLNFDDGTDEVHPRGKVTGAGGTWNEKFPSDSGRLGAPNPGLSDRNGPSDPDAKRDR